MSVAVNVKLQVSGVDIALDTREAEPEIATPLSGSVAETELKDFAVNVPVMPAQLSVNTKAVLGFAVPRLVRLRVSEP